MKVILSVTDTKLAQRVEVQEWLRACEDILNPILDRAMEDLRLYGSARIPLAEAAVHEPWCPVNYKHDPTPCECKQRISEISGTTTTYEACADCGKRFI